MRIKVIDLFCGAGGTTTGVEAAECFDNKVADVVACINHDVLAIKTHEINHPTCKHYTEDITIFDEHQLPQHDGENIWVLWASLECTNFSKAKGGKPREADSRTLANHLFRYINHIQPDYIMIENVREFLAWGPLDECGKPICRLNGRDYMKWRTAVEKIGYCYDHRFINAADHGAYTSRERYFGIFAKPGMPIVFPEPTHDKHARYGRQKWKAVKDVLDFTNEGESIFGRKKQLADKTLERIYAGLIKYVGNGDSSFLVKYLSNDAKTGINKGQSTNVPAPTMTTQGRIYAAFISKYYSGRPEGKNIGVDGPAGTIKTIDGQALVMAYYGTGDNISSTEAPAPTLTTRDRLAIFLMKYYNGGGQLGDIDDPASTILANDKHRLVFIDKAYSGKDNHGSVESPAGTILSNDKHALVSAQPFIMNTHFNNVGSEIDKPIGVITANRKHHYLVNPQWGVNGNASVEYPSPTLIARQDKAPLCMVQVEEGEFPAILIFEDDSEPMVRIKAFMAEHGIVDIKMRMLIEHELTAITGLPLDYFDKVRQSGIKLTSTAVKKYIGNAVVPVVPKRWIEALFNEIKLTGKKAA